MNNAFRACVDVIVGYLQIRLGNPDHAEEKSQVRVSSLTPREKLGRGLTRFILQAILLVGGFGDSPYLQRILRERFETAGPCIPILAPSSEQPGCVETRSRKRFNCLTDLLQIYRVKAVSAGGPWLFARRETVIARGLAFSYGVVSVVSTYAVR